MSDPTSLPTDEILLDLDDDEEAEAPEPSEHPGPDTLGELDWDGEGPLRWCGHPEAA